jgi:hypothetical protein
MSTSAVGPVWSRTAQSRLPEDDYTIIIMKVVQRDGGYE